VLITDLKLSGESVPVGLPVNGRVLLNRALPETQEITLKPREYEFSLEFAALHYISPERNQYAYMMEGLDRSWTYSGNRHFVTYTTLPPGEYRFRVKAANCDGLWNEAGTSLKIHILPPWYKTWWFQGFLIALLAGVVYLIIQMRLKVLRARTLILKKTVAARTRELAEANEALRDQSLTDPLTGLRNRRFLDVCMPDDVAQVQRIQRDVVNKSDRMKLNIDVLMIMMDIDHFKVVNDHYGHRAGDMVLQQMSVILQRAVRSSDTVARWGGEEFLIIARNSARGDASILPERIRAAVEAYAFDIAGPEPLRCKCSLGFCVFPFMPNETSLFTWEQVVDIADACLYAAKRNGRNAWVGLIPDTDCIEKLKDKLPQNPADLVKAQLFVPITSLRKPIQWED
jgi:diguanylate cyclase (GGDEF)-like protein